MIVWIIIATALAVFLAFAWRTKLKVRRYDIEVKDLPEQAEGIKIVHLSDFHDRERAGLREMVGELSPDLIFITGDFMDYGRDNDRSIALAEYLVSLAPVYYCPGNHECQCPDYEDMMLRLAGTGAHVLRDESAYVRGMRIVGFEDIDHSQIKERKKIFTDRIEKMEGQEFSVALFHHANLLGLMEGKNFALAFSGHVHGGQMRLPGGRGLISPDYEFLPEYCGGVYERGVQRFVVSRGLVFYPLFPRFFNPPEIVSVCLKNTIKPKN